MKKALILDGAIVQIEAEEFPVAAPLTWVDAPEDATIETHVYDGAAVVPKPAPPPPTPEQVIAKYTALIQKRLDDFAKTRGYDGVDSIGKYKDLTDAAIAVMPVDLQPMVTRYRDECKYLEAANSITWAKSELIMLEVKAGKRPVPTWGEMEAELPLLEWPV